MKRLSKAKLNAALRRARRPSKRTAKSALKRIEDIGAFIFKTLEKGPDYKARMIAFEKKRCDPYAAAVSAAAGFLKRLAKERDAEAGLKKESPAPPKPDAKAERVRKRR